MPEEKPGKEEPAKEAPAEVVAKEDKVETAEALEFINPNRVRRGNGNFRDCRWI